MFITKRNRSKTKVLWYKKTTFDKKNVFRKNLLKIAIMFFYCITKCSVESILLLIDRLSLKKKKLYFFLSKKCSVKNTTVEFNVKKKFDLNWVLFICFFIVKSAIVITYNLKKKPVTLRCSEVEDNNYFFRENKNY